MFSCTTTDRFRLQGYVQDARDIGLREQPDTEVMAIAVQQYAIIYGDAAVGYPASHDNGSTL